MAGSEQEAIVPLQQQQLAARVNSTGSCILDMKKEIDPTQAGFAAPPLSFQERTKERSLGAHC